MKDYGLTSYEANVLVSEKEISNYYEEVAKFVNSKFYLISVDGYFKSELSNIPPKVKIKKYSELEREEKDTFENMYQKHDDSKSDFFSILTYLVVLIFNLLTKSFSAKRC